MNTKTIKPDSVFGMAILNALAEGNESEVIQMCIDQMRDNFCMVMDVIGYENTFLIASDVVSSVNKYVHSRTV